MPNFVLMKDIEPQIEQHPWPPFIHQGARVLMLGTFPPKPERWSMPFFYPNKSNDFWKIMGYLFYDDSDHFWLVKGKQFDQARIEQFLIEQHIALWDTAMKVRRLKDNASDKFLEIVEQIDLQSLLAQYPTVKAVVTTGEKATGVVAGIAGVEPPAMGHSVEASVGEYSFTLYRMPSTSRAYPLALERKAQYYREMLLNEQLLISQSH